MNHIQGWITVRECYCHALEKGCLKRALELTRSGRVTLTARESGKVCQSSLYEILWAHNAPTWMAGPFFTRTIWETFKVYRVTIQNWPPEVELFCMMFGRCLVRHLPNRIKNSSISGVQSCIVTRNRALRCSFCDKVPTGNPICCLGSVQYQSAIRLEIIKHILLGPPSPLNWQNES